MEHGSKSFDHLYMPRNGILIFRSLNFQPRVDADLGGSRRQLAIEVAQHSDSACSELDLSQQTNAVLRVYGHLKRSR